MGDRVFVEQRSFASDWIFATSGKKLGGASGTSHERLIFDRWTARAPARAVWLSSEEKRSRESLFWD